MLKFTNGKVYLLTEVWDRLGEPRTLVARFKATVVDHDQEVRHKFLTSDGREAWLSMEDWIVEDGSELLWALG